MRLIHANVREHLNMRLYDRKGRVNKRDIKRFYRFMRCRRTGKRKRIAWRLIRNLYSISRAFNGKPIYVYSGYRYRPTLRGSRHARGQAIDFRIAGVSNRRLRDFIRKRFKRVGLGYYPNSLFVHLDVRKRTAFWVDASGPGEGARYVNAWQTLRAERAKAKAAKRKKTQLAKSLATNKVKPVVVLTDSGARLASAAKEPTAAPSKEKPSTGVKDSRVNPPPATPPVAGPPPVGPPPQNINGQAGGTEAGRSKRNGPKAAPSR